MSSSTCKHTNEKEMNESKLVSYQAMEEGKASLSAFIKEDQEGMKANDMITSESTRPGLGSRQISYRSTDLLRCAESREGHDKRVITSPAYSHGYLSPITPQEQAGSAPSTIKTPTSSISHDTRTLAQLYQSSRRSRQSPPKSGNNSATAVLPTREVPPPPFTLSVLTFDSQLQISDTANATTVNADDDDDWSFHVASPMCNSCSSNSLSSMENEEIVAITSKSFGEEEEGEDGGNVEREAKRRKTMA